ncbi:YraN family protein [Roseovarius sp.]|uniref:YraN family protein n=1 Tax=Roseovarius sp. TaxID=1486281 RepID=UPI002634BFFD|nr:YraN family protein [Roseovarius sp.]MDM8167284.1 YraN family protein [Roseovarius sp.]
MTTHFRFDEGGTATAVPAAKRRRGRRAYLSGVSAEKAVAREYDRRGADLLETRWRGQAGEIDLIFLDRGVYVFCEVKKASSFDAAAERLRVDQMQRIHLAASEYLGNTPQGQLSEVRFDLAVVDDRGQVEIRDAAFSHF